MESASDLLPPSQSPEFAALDAEADLSENEDEDAAPNDEADFTDSDDEDPSIDATVRRIEANPRARSIIEGAGLDVRDVVLMTFTLAAASLAHYAIEQGADPDSVAREVPIHLDNIRFVMEHQAELQAMRDGASGQ